MQNLVMAGLVPAIHVFLAATLLDVDAREKPGHDDHYRLLLHPLQLLDQRIQRVGEHHAATHGEPFRNHDAL
jgi:hypothetical protein